MPLALQEAPGLRTVLHNGDFGQWERLIAATLGHHRPLDPDPRLLLAGCGTSFTAARPGACPSPADRGRPAAGKGRRISLEELALAMGISVRTLPYDFQEQLGCPPMAELKRLRLRRLRQLLLEAVHDHRSLADLMQAAGLLGCGATAADDGRCWGESPRRTRQRRTMDS